MVSEFFHNLAYPENDSVLNFPTFILLLFLNRFDCNILLFIRRLFLNVTQVVVSFKISIVKFLSSCYANNETYMNCYRMII